MRGLAGSGVFVTVCGRRARAQVAFLALAALLAPVLPGAAAAQEVRLVVGGAIDGEAYRLAEILSGPLGEALGRPVATESMAGGNGVAAARTVVEAAPDGATLRLANNLLLAVNEATADWPFALDALRPLAKLTTGISVALAAPADSDITNWQALLDRAVAGALRLSIADQETAYVVARAMLESGAGLSFETVTATDQQASAANVEEGRADLAIITTNRIEDHNATAEVAFRPIVTFGAQRSPLYPKTPTLAEFTGDDKNDFTYSFAMFGPGGLSDDLTTALAEAVQRACLDPEAVVAASAAELPLACHDAGVAQATIARDLGVAHRIAAFLDR